MSASVWQEQTGDLREAFECLVPLVRGRYVKVVVGDAIRLWGEKMLELADNLVDEVKATRKDVVRLRSHIAELERSLALDSTNSSKPPSSDGPGKKRKRTQSERTPTGRPSGGQPGHKATTLEQTPTPDRLVDHDPTACPGCGAPLSEADREGKPAVRQVFDLPEPSPLEVTEHRAHSCRCASCSTLTRGAFPQDVRGPVQYGPRITGFVSYLLDAQLLPENRLRELLCDLFGVKISKATIAAMAQRTADRFETFTEQLTGLLRSALVPVKHLDETTVRVNSGQSWIHVLCTKLLTVLRIGSGRGDVGQDFEGILVHDAFSSYFGLEAVRHATCHAHHLRELKALARIDKEAWAQRMRDLLLRARKALIEAGNGNIPDSVRRDISSAWDQTVNDGIAYHQALPPLPTRPHGRPKRRPGHNCALRLAKRKAECLRFLYDPEVPFTNNQAERDLRMVKLRQKISGGFRTTKGAQRFATLRTVIHTARKQGWNVLDTLAHPDPIQLIPQLRLSTPLPPSATPATTDPPVPG